MGNDTITIDRNVLLQVHHEIRNPLNALLGFIDIFCSDTKMTNKECMKYKNIIKENSDQLYRIDEVLSSLISDENTKE